MRRAGLVSAAALLLALACCSRAQDESLAALKALPGCEAALWDMYLASSTEPACREWVNTAVATPCPVECQKAFQALGEECYASVAQYTWKSLGVAVGPDAVTPYVNATFTACESGMALELEPAAKFLEDALQGYVSCAAVEVDRVLESGCSFQMVSQASQSGFCPTQCSVFLKALGADCFVDVVVGGAAAMGAVQTEEQRTKAREAMRALYDKCAVRRRLLEWDGADPAEAAELLAAVAAAAAMPVPHLLLA